MAETWIEKLWKGISNFFEMQSEKIWTYWRDLTKDVVKDTWAFWRDTAAKVEPQAWQTMLQAYEDLGLLTPEAKADLYKLKDAGHPWDIIFYIGLQMQLFTATSSLHLDAAKAISQQAIFKNLRPSLPNFGDVIRAAFVAPEKAGEVREIAKRLGIPDEIIDLIFLANYALYDVNTIGMLYNRGVLSGADMFERMRELGFTDTRIQEIKETWKVMPGIQDLLTMVAHEAFEPDAIQKLGLDDEFPHEQVQWMQKQGLSEDWVRKYWYAHWDQPSIQQGYEMLHRGIIDLETLDMLYRTVEIPPYWRDKLTAIAYQPYTRVDVRRMHDMGVLTDEELKKAYMDLGYDEEHAEKMMLFTIRYNQQSKKEITSSQILAGYREKIIEEQDAKDLLMQLDYTDAQADYLLQFETYKELKAYQDDVIDNIRDLYQNRLIDKAEAMSKLNELNLPAKQRDLLLDKWDIRLYRNRKLPSKSDLDKMLRYKIISLDEYRQEMEKLGYNFRYILWYEKLAEKKK